MNILMVCLGNICRSPLAEGILKDKLKSSGLRAEVHSAGTSDYHVGEPADPRTIDVAKKHNIDITTHRARQFTADDFKKYDLIYAMDRSNYDKIIQLAKNEDEVQKVELYLNVSSPGSNSEVPDPYWSGKDGFEHVFRLLDHTADKLIEEIESERTKS